MATGNYTLYSLATPNGMKVACMLEELKDAGEKINYDAHTIDITQGQQHEGEFAKLTPNHKIPVIHDADTGNVYWESGSILLALAEKHGRFLPQESKAQVYNWLFWLQGSAPYIGQIGYFWKYANETSEMAKTRFAKETRRIMGVLEKQLENGREYITGKEMTIADFAVFPWMLTPSQFYGEEACKAIGTDDFPKVNEYVKRCKARPACERGMKVTPFPKKE